MMTTDTSMPCLMTRHEAARRLGISLSALRRLAIPSVLVGKRSRRFDPADLDLYVLHSKEGAVR